MNLYSLQKLKKANIVKVTDELNDFNGDPYTHSIVYVVVNNDPKNKNITLATNIYDKETRTTFDYKIFTNYPKTTLTKLTN